MTEIEPHSAAHAWEVLLWELRVLNYAMRDLFDVTCDGWTALDNWRRATVPTEYVASPADVWDGTIHWKERADG